MDAVPISLLRVAVFTSYQAAFYTFLVARRSFAALRPEHAWRTWITPDIMVGGFLISNDVRELERQGVAAVVNTTNELVEPVEALDAAGIAYLQIPCWDRRSPSLEDTDRALDFIATQRRQGKRVYVHCASGAGRSVAVVTCYLALHEGLSTRDAFDRIKARRRRANLSETQARFVETYVSTRRARYDARDH